MRPPPARRLLSTVEVTDRFGIHRTTLFLARSQGRLRTYHPETGELFDWPGRGWKVKWDEQEIRRWRDGIPPTPIGDPLPDRAEWIDRAKCRGVNTTEVFDPPDGDLRKAQGLCFSCPVRLDCVRWLVQANVTEIYGGGANQITLKRARRRFRKLGLLPSICRWCGDVFSPVAGEMFCKQACFVKNEKAGGLDPKPMSAATPKRRSV